VADFDQYLVQPASTLNAGGINYGLLRRQDAMKRLNDLERLSPES
jgi:arylsulfatase